MCNNAIKSLSDFVTNNRILDDNKVDNYNQTVNRHIPVSKDNIQQNHANFKNFQTSKKGKIYKEWHYHKNRAYEQGRLKREINFIWRKGE